MKIKVSLIIIFTMINCNIYRVNPTLNPANEIDPQTPARDCNLSRANLTLNLVPEKTKVHKNERLKIDLVIMCEDEKGCILDTRIFERMKKGVYYFFIKLDGPPVNQGFLVTGQYLMGDSFFFLPASCEIICHKEIDLSFFKLPAGKYELKFTVPAYQMPEKVDMTLPNKYKIQPYTESLVGKVVIQILP